MRHGLAIGIGYASGPAKVAAMENDVVRTGDQLLNGEDITALAPKQVEVARRHARSADIPAGKAK
jgi:hypothetical protein